MNLYYTTFIGKAFLQIIYQLTPNHQIIRDSLRQFLHFILNETNPQKLTSFLKVIQLDQLQFRTNRSVPMAVKVICGGTCNSHPILQISAI